MEGSECGKCNNIFKEFNFFNLGDPFPDKFKRKKKVVYAIKIKGYGEPVKDYITLEHNNKTKGGKK